MKIYREEKEPDRIHVEVGGCHFVLERRHLEKWRDSLNSFLDDLPEENYK